MKKQYMNWKKGVYMAAVCLLLAGCGEKEEIQTSEAVSQASSYAAEVKEETTKSVTETEKVTEEMTKEENSTESASESQPEQPKSTAESQEDVAKSSEESKEEQSEASSESQPEQSESTAESQKDVAKSVSEIYQDIESQVTLHSMVSMPDEFITNYYGVDTDTLEEYIFAMSEDATSAETVIIMKAKDAEKLDGITTALQMVIDEKKAEMENYLPEQYDIVSKSEVKVSGSYVYLVISDHADTIQSIIQDEIS